jgi:hypothetical protein
VTAAASGGDAYRVAQLQRLRAQRPYEVLQPVDLSTVDVRDAVSLVRQAVEFAGKIVGIDAYVIAALSAEVVRSVCTGKAADGLRLDELCRNSQTGSGRVRDHFGEPLVQAVDIAVRALTVLQGRPVIYDRLFSIAVRTRRSSTAIGSDHIQGAAATLRMMGLAHSGRDRCVSTIDMTLTTDTRDDPTSPRANPERIAQLTEDLGHAPAGTVGEHTKELLARHARARRAVITAAIDRPRAFDGIGMTPDAFASHAFADYVIGGGLACGPPHHRCRAHARVVHPGLEPDVVAALVQMKRKGVLSRGPLRGDAGVARDLRSEGFEQFGPERTPLDERLALMPSYGVEWWRSIDSRRIIRREVAQSRQSAKSVRSDDWLVVGLEERPDVAVALIQRFEQQWTQGCIDRAMEACAPGMLLARGAQQQEALRALLRLANAAIVAANRHWLQQRYTAR